jgi:hypothetical protein
MITPLAAVLAQNNFGDTESGGMAGPMGLFIIVLLAIATVLLVRNMNARLRRLPDRFPVPGAEPASVIENRTDTGGNQAEPGEATGTPTGSAEQQTSR